MTISDRHLHTANAFETTLSAQMGPTDLTASVNSTSGAPSTADDGMILCIDPEDDNKREYILFEGSTSSSFTTTTINNRYLDGSAAGSGITHDSGAEVRAVPTQQFIEDLHDRIDADMDTSTGHDHDGSDSKTLGAGSIGASQLAAEAVRDEHFDDTDTPLTRQFRVGSQAAEDALSNLRHGDELIRTDLGDHGIRKFWDGSAWVPVSGQLLETVTLGATGTISLTNIVSGFSKLTVRWSAQSARAGSTLDALYCFIDGDTTVANYHHQELRGDDGSAANLEGATPAVGFVPAASNAAEEFGTGEAHFVNYDEASRIKQAFSQYTYLRVAGRVTMGSFGMVHEDGSTGVIDTSLVLDGENADLVSGSWAELWGY